MAPWLATAPMLMAALPVSRPPVPMVRVWLALNVRVAAAVMFSELTVFVFRFETGDPVILTLSANPAEFRFVDEYWAKPAVLSAPTPSPGM